MRRRKKKRGRRDNKDRLKDRLKDRRKEKKNKKDKDVLKQSYLKKSNKDDVKLKNKHGQHLQVTCGC